MNLLLVLGMALCARAADFSWQTALQELIVRKEPRDGARVLFYIPSGDRFMVGSEVKGFRKIRIRRAGKVRSGFVAVSALSVGDRSDPAPLEGDWAIGPGIMSSRLVQANKSFSTPDQVQYVTTDYLSSTVFPLLATQLGRTDFWRILVLSRQVKFKFSARSDVASSSPKDVELSHRMLALAVQKSWTARFFPPLYGGIGLEGARALATDLKMNGSELTTDSSNKPFYLAAHALGGLQFLFTRRWSFYLEGRYNWIPNQSPVVTGTDFSATVMYWP